MDSAQLAESGMVVVVIVRWYSHNETARHLVGHLLMVEQFQPLPQAPQTALVREVEIATKGLQKVWNLLVGGREINATWAAA